MEKIKSISVVIPAYNEEKIIKTSISQLDARLKSFANDYEIIVINDGSTDQTARCLKGMSADIKALKIISNKSNLNLGGSLKAGFAHASKELVFYTDADMPIDYGEIYRISKMLEDAKSDIILGYRKNRGSESLLRILSSIVYNRLVRGMFGIKVRDINFSCKMIKRHVLDKLNLKSEGLFIDAEMVIKAIFMGYRVRESGVAYYSRTDGRSHLFRPGIILHTLYEMIKYYPEIKKLKPQRLNPLALFHTAIRSFIIPFEEIEKYIPEKARVLDFGCGYGNFVFLLCRSSGNRRIIGVDIDKRKISIASRLSPDKKAVIFTDRSISSFREKEFDAISAIDVLYLVPDSEKEALFKNFHRILKEGGILAIKTMDPRKKAKFTFNYIQEFISVKLLGFTKSNGRRLHFITDIESFKNTLREIGFTAEEIPLDKGYLYPHLLLLCRKR